MIMSGTAVRCTAPIELVWKRLHRVPCSWRSVLARLLAKHLGPEQVDCALLTLLFCALAAFLLAHQLEGK